MVVIVHSIMSVVFLILKVIYSHNDSLNLMEFVFVFVTRKFSRVLLELHGYTDTYSSLRKIPDGYAMFLFNLLLHFETLSGEYADTPNPLPR